eukprot:6554524-Prymnesium_polylepis.2
MSALPASPVSSLQSVEPPIRKALAPTSRSSTHRDDVHGVRVGTGDATHLGLAVDEVRTHPVDDVKILPSELLVEGLPQGQVGHVGRPVVGDDVVEGKGDATAVSGRRGRSQRVPRLRVPRLCEGTRARHLPGGVVARIPRTIFGKLYRVSCRSCVASEKTISYGIP